MPLLGAHAIQTLLNIPQTKMGCVPSSYERTEYDRYAIFDERDRDDFDDCWGCGPWYGSETYRIARRQYLPGYGSSRGNYFGRGGYAGQYIPPVGLGNELVTSSTQMAVVPYRRSPAVVAAPVQSGYIAAYNGMGNPMGGYGYGYGNNGGQYRRGSGMW